MGKEGYTPVTVENLDSYAVHAAEQEEIWHEWSVYEAEYMENVI